MIEGKTAVAPKQNRLTLKALGDYHYKWGKLWAFAKKRPLSRLISDVFEARVEANQPEIEKMIRDVAEQRGQTFEELVDEILKTGDEE